MPNTPYEQMCAAAVAWDAVRRLAEVEGEDAFRQLVEKMTARDIDPRVRAYRLAPHPGEMDDVRRGALAVAAAFESRGGK